MPSLASRRFHRVLHIVRAPIRRFGLRLLGVAVLLSASGAVCPVSAQVAPAVGGQWSQIFDWSGQITCPTACTDASDLSAGAVLPVGLHRGKVVFWRQSCTGCGTTSRTTESWLFDPADPDDLIKIIHPQLDSDLFCAGFSWDRDGSLLVTGGAAQDPNLEPAVKTYYFEPSLLGHVLIDLQTGARAVEGSAAWERIGDLGNPNDWMSGRYYPSVCPLNRRPLAGSPAFQGGGHLVLGGSPDPTAPPSPGTNCTDPGGHPAWNHGSSNWQHIGPSQTAWDQRVLYPLNGAMPSVPNPLPYDRRDVAGNLVNNDQATNPFPALETYPRAFQLADFGNNQKQQVFIANDMPTFSNLWRLYNPYGAAWIVKPAFGMQGWELQEAPTGLERFYGNALLFHCQPANGGLNRVVVLGGARNTSTAPVPEDAPNWGLVPTVQEFVIPGGQGAAAGQWVTKSTGPSRIMANSVILPTGQVLILGGSTSVNSCDAGPGLPAAYSPQLYDIGPLPTSPGTTIATMNLSNVLPAGPVPRLYHSMAALLEDGRVLVAAGENYPASAGVAGSGKNGEIFSPPYLFQGTRPTIRAAPSEAQFWSAGQPTITLSINHSNPVDRIVLLRPATVTHAFDIDQRYIELAYTIQSSSPGTHPATVTLPTEDLGPPGWYMMYAVQINAQGQRVPSIAWWIHIT